MLMPLVKSANPFPPKPSTEKPVPPQGAGLGAAPGVDPKGQPAQQSPTGSAKFGQEQTAPTAQAPVVGQTATGEPMTEAHRGKHTVPEWGDVLVTQTTPGHESQTPMQLQHEGKHWVRAGTDPATGTAGYHEYKPERHVLDADTGFAREATTLDAKGVSGGLVQMSGLPESEGGELPDVINDPHHGRLSVRTSNPDSQTTLYHKDIHHPGWDKDGKGAKPDDEDEEQTGPGGVAKGEGSQPMRAKPQGVAGAPAAPMVQPGQSIPAKPVPPTAGAPATTPGNPVKPGAALVPPKPIGAARPSTPPASGLPQRPGAPGVSATPAVRQPTAVAAQGVQVAKPAAPAAPPPQTGSVPPGKKPFGKGLAALEDWFEKSHKYIKRTGGPGNYVYTYPGEGGGAGGGGMPQQLGLPLAAKKPIGATGKVTTRDASGKESLDFEATAANAKNMTDADLDGALADIHATLEHADQIDRVQGTDRGGLYRDEASVYNAEKKRRAGDLTAPRPGQPVNDRGRRIASEEEVYGRKLSPEAKDEAERGADSTWRVQHPEDKAPKVAKLAGAPLPRNYQDTTHEPEVDHHEEEAKHSNMAWGAAEEWQRLKRAKKKKNDPELLAVVSRTKYHAAMREYHRAMQLARDPDERDKAGMKMLAGSLKKDADRHAAALSRHQGRAEQNRQGQISSDELIQMGHEAAGRSERATRDLSEKAKEHDSAAAAYEKAYEKLKSEGDSTYAKQFLDLAKQHREFGNAALARAKTGSPAGEKATSVLPPRMSQAEVDAVPVGGTIRTPKGATAKRLSEDRWHFTSDMGGAPTEASHSRIRSDVDNPKEHVGWHRVDETSAGEAAQHPEKGAGLDEYSQEKIARASEQYGTEDHQANVRALAKFPMSHLEGLAAGASFALNRSKEPNGKARENLLHAALGAMLEKREAGSGKHENLEAMATLLHNLSYRDAVAPGSSVTPSSIAAMIAEDPKAAEAVDKILSERGSSHGKADAQYHLGRAEYDRDAKAAGEAPSAKPRKDFASQPEVKKYINRIRKPAKKEYAKAYAKWMAAGEKTDEEPEAPEGLGGMGRQAVRMSLEDLKAKKSMPGITALEDYLEKADKIPGGLAAKRDPASFDSKSVARGRKVEMEHTTDPKVAEEIARDHLTEDPSYYEKLARMEAKKSMTNGGDKVSLAIERLLSSNPKPDDAQVHALAGKLGMEVDDLEERIYALAGKQLSKCGAEKAAKAMDAIAGLVAFVKSNEDPMPDESCRLGYEKGDEIGASPDGGTVEGKGKPPARGERVGEPVDVGGKPVVDEDKLSDDDRDPEKQMDEGTTALEREVREKSLTPAAQRAMTAHERAVMVSSLQKSDDVCIGVSTPHPYSIAALGDTDAAAADLCKSEFYAQGTSPIIGAPKTVLREHVLCKSEGCGVRYPAAFTACPECGTGSVVNRALPQSGYSGIRSQDVVIEPSANHPMLRRPPREDDVSIG